MCDVKPEPLLSQRPIQKKGKYHKPMRLPMKAKQTDWSAGKQVRPGTIGEVSPFDWFKW